MQLFNFGRNEVRVVEKAGDVWFVLKEVCEALGDIAPRVVRQRLTDDVCSTYPISDALGRMQETTIINEDGLYDVILESRKPEAKAFRKWITSEVIPTIRKHGAYMTPETIERTLTDPDFIIGLATRLKEEQEKNAGLQARIVADRPLVLYAESMQVSEDAILVRDLAKLLKQNGMDIGETRLFKQLREEGYLIKAGSDYNMPTQRSMELKIMEIKMGHRGSSDGTVKITRTPKITGKGQVYFINKYIGAVREA